MLWPKTLETARYHIRMVLSGLTSDRKVFPPTEEDLPTGDGQPQHQAHEGALLAQMPVPPSFDPADRGQPDAKKLKVAHADADDDWEQIEQPNLDVKEDEEMVTVTGAEAQAGPGASNDVRTLAGDGGGHSNRLLKDW